MKNWKEIIKEESEKDYFIKLKKFIDEEYEKNEVFPKRKNIFRALELTPFENVRVVLIGQDPYHGINQAQGLSFSVDHSVKIPPSLQNIYKELSDEYGMEIPAYGSLENWAKQGVLLLNTSLTVRAHEPTSHSNIGWEKLTLRFIKELSSNENKIIFILLGNHAKKFEPYIDKDKNFIVKAAHPSPFSAYKGFFGSNIFKKTNDILLSIGHKKINWSVYKAIVFDLDGTIIDTKMAINKAVNESLRRLNFSEISLEKTTEFTGEGIDKLIDKTIEYKKIDFEYKAELRKLLLENFNKYTFYNMKVFDDLEYVLKQLYDNGFLLGVYTNKPEDVAKKIVDKFLPDIFTFVIGNNDSYELKPDIRHLGITIGKYGIDLRDVIYVGDSEVDIITGNNGKMKTIAVDWGFRKSEDLFKYNPHKIIHEPKELLKEIIN